MSDDNAIEVSVDGGVTRVTIHVATFSGNDTLELSAAGFEAAVKKAPSPPRVVIDLSRVEVITSAAIGLLLNIARKVHGRNGKTSLFGANANVSEVLAIVRINRAVSVTKTYAEAKKAVG